MKLQILGVFSIILIMVLVFISACGNSPTNSTQPTVTPVSPNITNTPTVTFTPTSTATPQSISIVVQNNAGLSFVMSMDSATTIAMGSAGATFITYTPGVHAFYMESTPSGYGGINIESTPAYSTTSNPLVLGNNYIINVVCGSLSQTCAVPFTIGAISGTYYYLFWSPP